ncbi:hypothetical protein ESCO_006182 [Escovopsis weberi]|uniref:DUF427 domain-containing protein n=1 Tax=Escovopsis weberi TaxID=150374 RepID=A0A0M9VUS9_ESCWE|nr:hypothetical protein ESCO_006182 [Escovopsis weberi]
MVLPGSFGLADLASTLLTNGPRKALPVSSPRRVRVLLNSSFIIDSTSAILVWEHDAYPHYYFPLSELRHCTFRDKRAIKADGVNRAAVVEITVPGKNGQKDRRTERALRFTNDRSLGALSGLLRLEFGSMDQWLDEDLPIHVHPKDPFKRIDVLPSLRALEIRIFGHPIARSTFSMHLHETGLPTRFYIPFSAILDQSILRGSARTTSCPYKGTAEYFHAVIENNSSKTSIVTDGETGEVTVVGKGEVFRDIAWSYRVTTAESGGVAGLVAFHQERADVDVILDGEVLERPRMLT